MFKKLVLCVGFLFLVGLVINFSTLSGSSFNLEDVVKNSKDNDIINLPTDAIVTNKIFIDHNLTIKGDSLALLDLENVNGLFTINENCTLTLSHVKVSNENLKSSLIFNKGRLILEDCLFENNNGIVNGLIINNDFNSSIKVNNCSFIGNDAGNATKGAVLLMNYSKDALINNSKFISNQAYHGGVVYNDLYDNGMTSITNCEFKSNHAYKGGSVYNKDSSLSIMNNSFQSNEASSSSFIGLGGAVYNDNSDDLKIVDSDFSDNVADCGGAVFTTTAISSIGHSNFTNNHAQSGGALYNKDGGKQTYAYNNTRFIGNGDKITGGSYGGAIVINNGVLVLSRSILNNNGAEHGGAVYSTDSTLKISDSSFNNNARDMMYNNDLGGSICSVNTDIELAGTVFNSSESGNGGAIYSDKGNVEIVDAEGRSSSFINNHASGSGGGLFITGDLKIIGEEDNILFVNNTAGGDGGGIFSSSALDLENISFQSNTATGDGGAVRTRGFVSDSPRIVISSSQFNNNTAGKGAGVFLTETSNAILNNLNFINNKAISSGIIYNNAGNYLTMNNTNFMNNVCDFNIFHFSGKKCNIINNTINDKDVTMDLIGYGNDYYRNQVNIINTEE